MNAEEFCEMINYAQDWEEGIRGGVTAAMEAYARYKYGYEMSRISESYKILREYWEKYDKKKGD